MSDAPHNSDPDPSRGATDALGITGAASGVVEAGRELQALTDSLFTWATKDQDPYDRLRKIARAVAGLDALRRRLQQERSDAAQALLSRGVKRRTVGRWAGYDAAAEPEKSLRDLFRKHPPAHGEAEGDSGTS